MLKERPVTAVVPARGGSKGIARKNLLRLGRDTLLERAFKLGLSSPWVDRVVVTTDDPEMQAIAARYGVAAPALRPAHLASDAATTAEAVVHLVGAAGIAPGWLLLLQPTCPLRTLADLDALARGFAAYDADAAASVVRHEAPRPEKLQKIEGGWLAPYLGAAFEGPRQALPPAYALNGAFYLIDRDHLLAGGRFLPPRTMPFVMSEERSFSLDAPHDWQILNTMVRSGAWPLEEYDIAPSGVPPRCG